MFIAVLIIAIVEFLILVVTAQRNRARRYDGRMVVTETETKKVFSLELDRDPDDLSKQRRMTLKVLNNVDEVGSRE